MFRPISKSIVIAVSVLLSSAVVAVDMSRLEEKKSQLNEQYIELERHNMGYMAKKIELETTKSKLRRLKQSAAGERFALDEMIKAQEKSPGVDYADKIESQRSEWRKINKLYLSQKEYARILQDKVEQDKINYKITQQKIASSQHSISGMFNALSEQELNRQLSSLRKSQDIEISTVETCSLSVTKDDCIDKARVRAERDAAERGSLVVIDAVTEVKDFNLTKDEVRSRVSARISNIQVIKKSFDLTPDRTGWRVEYAITATVTPAIHEDMRSQLKQQITTMFTSGIVFRDISTRDLPDIIELPPEEEQDFSAYAPPPAYVAPAPAYAPPPAYVAPVPAYVAPKTPAYAAPAPTTPRYVPPTQAYVPAVPDAIMTERTTQEILEETEKEMRAIRKAAVAKATKKEEVEAKDELDSRSITIMVF
ncbi:MAG: hypothetical protein H8E21_09125 [Gammaproteobacteria bacterium]|nr:hypothetical protein [Gammaproteobacteria bacterium]